jgi:hypothetical protein
LINRQRDYIEWLIEQVGQALAEIAQMVKEGKFDLALLAIQRTTDLVVPPPMRALLDRLEAASAVAVLGPSELDRVRMYAALLGEQGALHELRGRTPEATSCYRRSLELYTAAASAGAALMEADHERIAAMRDHVGEAPD